MGDPFPVSGEPPGVVEGRDGYRHGCDRRGTLVLHMSPRRGWRPVGSKETRDVALPEGSRQGPHHRDPVGDSRPPPDPVSGTLSLHHPRRKSPDLESHSARPPLGVRAPGASSTSRSLGGRRGAPPPTLGRARGSRLAGRSNLTHK